MRMYNLYMLRNFQSTKFRAAHNRISLATYTTPGLNTFTIHFLDNYIDSNAICRRFIDTVTTLTFLSTFTMPFRRSIISLFEYNIQYNVFLVGPAFSTCEHATQRVIHFLSYLLNKMNQVFKLEVGVRVMFGFKLFLIPSVVHKIRKACDSIKDDDLCINFSK